MSRRLPSGSRRITSLSEVGRAGDGGVELHQCVAYDEATDAWALEDVPRFVDVAVRERLLDEGEVRRWRSSLA